MSTREERSGCILGCAFMMLLQSLSWIGSLIHIYVTWYAFEDSGIWAAILTLGTPVVAEIYWAFKIASAAGSWWNYYTVVIVCFTLLYVISLFFLADRTS